MTYISEEKLLRYQDKIDKAKNTVRTYRATPAIQLRRRDATTGNFANAGAAFVPVKIELANRLETTTGANSGMVQVMSGGTMEVQAGIDIRRDDRFAVDGVWYEVELVRPAENVFGYRRVELTRLGG